MLPYSSLAWRKRVKNNPTNTPWVYWRLNHVTKPPEGPDGGGGIHSNLDRETKAKKKIDGLVGESTGGGTSAMIQAQNSVS